jgi:hypothetical protein
MLCGLLLAALPVGATEAKVLRRVKDPAAARLFASIGAKPLDPSRRTRLADFYAKEGYESLSEFLSATESAVRGDDGTWSLRRHEGWLCSGRPAPSDLDLAAQVAALVSEGEWVRAHRHVEERLAAPNTTSCKLVVLWAYTSIGWSIADRERKDMEADETALRILLTAAADLNETPTGGGPSFLLSFLADYFAIHRDYASAYVAARGAEAAAKKGADGIAWRTSLSERVRRLSDALANARKGKLE